MAKSVLKSLNCELCGHVCKSVGMLSKHLKLNHSMSNVEYTIKILLNGTIPTCICGCGKEVKVYPYKINECYVGHSGGGNWQTKYDKNSEEYKSAISKVSKSVKEYMSINPPIFSEDTKQKHSNYMKKLLSDPEERERRRIKMQNTKKEQSKSGILSKNHFTNTKTKEEVVDIYKNIGDKSSKTKLDKYRDGLLIPWNSGKSAEVDDRIANSSGKNHYRFNPNKEEETPYKGTFYNKKYRVLLREQQNGVCFSCKLEGVLCLHHIDENKKNDSFENLIFVCRSCHSKIHNSKHFQVEFNKRVGEFKQNTVLNLKEIGE